MTDTKRQKQLDAKNLEAMKAKIKEQGCEKVLADRDLKIAVVKLFASTPEGRECFKGLRDKYAGAVIADPDKTFAHACEAQGKVNLLREIAGWISNFNNGTL